MEVIWKMWKHAFFVPFFFCGRIREMFPEKTKTKTKTKTKNKNQTMKLQQPKSTNEKPNQTKQENHDKEKNNTEKQE